MEVGEVDDARADPGAELELPDAERAGLDDGRIDAERSRYGERAESEEFSGASSWRRGRGSR
jgi:hypothetical protein